MLIRIKNPISQFFCKQKYERFETLIDKISNPHGFMSLNEDMGILVCVKCGKHK